MLIGRNLTWTGIRRPTASHTRLLVGATLGPLSAVMLFVLASQSMRLAQASHGIRELELRRETLRQIVSETGSAPSPSLTEPWPEMPALERFLSAAQHVDSRASITIKEIARGSAPDQLSRISFVLQGDPNRVARVLSALEGPPTHLVLTGIQIVVKSGDVSTTVWNLSGVLP